VKSKSKKFGLFVRAGRYAFRAFFAVLNRLAALFRQNHQVNPCLATVSQPSG
jgi:hypothetical protein